MDDEAIRREIAEARRIVREDKILVSHNRLSAKLDKHFPDEPEPDPNVPPAPPAAALSTTYERLPRS